MQYLGYTYTEKAFLVHPIFKFIFVFSILSGNLLPPHHQRLASEIYKGDEPFYIISDSSILTEWKTAIV